MTRALPNATTSKALIRQRVEAVRPHLKRVFAFINGKGGAGKTTLTANASGTLARALAEAESGRRVLAIQLDHQGDLGLDLGIRYSEQDDDGASIRDCVVGTGQLKVVRDVRPNLDVVSSGKQVDVLGSYLKASDNKGRMEARLRFAEALAALAHEYDWILIDCPPGDEELQVLALVAAQWIVIPVQFDASSRYGLEGVSDAVEEAEELNPDLYVLGVVMFAFDRRDLRRSVDKGTGEETYREIGQRARVRKKLNMELERLQVDAIVFESVISLNRSVAEDCREYGRLVAEAADASKHPDWRKVRKANELSAFTNDAAEGLAADYDDFTGEFVARVRMLEAQIAQETETNQ